MDYQPLGRTGVPVSQVGRGAMVPEASGSLGQDDVVQLTRVLDAIFQVSTEDR
jgi:aryl-alcohol dehydrogenase-like predicted oxidoreductase